MKVYVQFTHVRENKVVDNMGSDGVFILDARNNLKTMIYDVMIQQHKLRKVADIDGYKIIKSDRFTDDPNAVIYDWTRSGAKETLK